MTRSIFDPPQWGPPSTGSARGCLHFDNPDTTPEDAWAAVARLERDTHGDRLVWIRKLTTAGAEDGCLVLTYRIIVRRTA